MYELKPELVEAPPRSVPGILRRLGPGLIIAGSIVGSGELIATTKTGAQAGFWLLWLSVTDLSNRRGGRGASVTVIGKRETPTRFLPTSAAAVRSRVVAAQRE